MNVASVNLVDPGGALAIADDATVSRSMTMPALHMWGRFKTLLIKLNGLSHTFPGDLDFLLVGPDGTNLEFWSDAGGSTDMSNQIIIIRDDAAALLPDSGGVATGEYRPADYGSAETNSNWTGLPPGLVINHPAPNGAATLNASFAGKWLGNSTWTLFIRDDDDPDSGILDDWSVQGVFNIICKPHDFNGTFSNSASDILWQHNDGTPGIWLMDGFFATSVGPAGPNAPWPSNPGPSWHVKGDGDFDDDGRSDILWQNDDGTPAIWRMNGFTATAMSAVGTNPGAAWQIKGTGDFNFDNKADILWQNLDGTPGIWLMDGMNVLAAGAVGTNPGASWQVKDSADFNNDGKADILWQNTDGTAGIWLMDGLTVLNAGAVGTNPGASWQIKGTGDFNNDGKADMLWQNADGTPGIWLMDGMNVLAAGPVGTNPGASWHVVGSGDYDADQQSDILWQNDDGRAGVWTMNGLSVLSAGVAGSFNPGPDWHIIG